MDVASRTPSRELTSWKEIADYLGITVRTAQKWEQERGLPVRRLPGGRGRVYALVAELDAWKGAGVHPGNSGARVSWLVGHRLALALGLVLIGASALAYVLARRAGPPVSWRLELNTLVVSDDRGRELWRKSFTENLLIERYNQSTLTGKDKVWFGDVNGDGKAETLFTLDYLDEGAHAGVLVCLTDHGQEMWRFTPGRRVQSPKEHFSSHFRIMKVAVAKLVHQYAKSVLVVSYNYPDYPTQVALLSPEGRLVREYWHSGYIGGDYGLGEWLRIADLNGDGRSELYLGGLNNAYEQATLVALDPEVMSGASVEENVSYQLQGFEPGREIGRVLFPRSCVNRIRHEYNSVIELNVDRSLLLVATMEELSPDTSGLFYGLDARLRLRSFKVSDSFRSRHRELFNAGELDHSWSAEEEAGMHDIRVFRSADIRPAPQGLAKSQ